jgi:agmatinase
VISSYFLALIAFILMYSSDTWKPSIFGGAPSDQAAINHGTYFYWASQEGLINNGTSIASRLY